MSQQGFEPCIALAAYHAAVDAHDLDAIRRWFAADAVYASAGLGEVNGREAIMDAMKAYFEDCPDHHSWDDDISATGPHSARARWQLKATSRKTGRSVHRRGVEDVVFDADGLILKILVEDHVQ